MAGYVLKITLENTHPLVWRRIVIPEKITFEDLHYMLQIVFGWENDHMHEFSAPSRKICVGIVTEDWGGCEYDETEILVEELLLHNKWIRYTYDFGDDWIHKIVCEKKDDTYDKRVATLLKAKGDNFVEDSGGVWGNDSRVPFDFAEAAAGLENLYCPMNEELENWEIEPLSEEELENELEELMEQLRKEARDSQTYHDNIKRNLSPIEKKIEAWEAFLKVWNVSEEPHEEMPQLKLDFVEEEDSAKEEGITLELAQSSKTTVQLLEKHSVEEVKRICRHYLQLPVERRATKQVMLAAIVDAFYAHPDYLLCVFKEKEYEELKLWMEYPCGKVETGTKLPDVLLKALFLGLAEVRITHKKSGDCAVYSFAQDGREILTALNEKDQKKFFQNRSAITSKMQEFVMSYGVIETDSMYTLFCRTYHMTIEREDFNRYLFWYAGLNDVVVTGQCMDGTCYASSPQLDMREIIDDIQRHASDIDYIEHTAQEIKKTANNIGERSEWLGILCETLIYRMGLEEESAVRIVEEAFCNILNGERLSFVLEEIPQKWKKSRELEILCELWTCLSTLMLELELPMLKGRSRKEYAEEKGISAWQIQMVYRSRDIEDAKAMHMQEFPADIQGDMELAHSYADHERMQKLLDYKKKKHIQSEEFLYLLAESHIIGGEFKTAAELIRELEASSERGRQAAGKLWKMLESGADVMDEYDEEMPAFSWDEEWGTMREPQKPYVREAPKIGRNAPCPCGSGKKYKKCCGR